MTVAGLQTAGVVLQALPGTALATGPADGLNQVYSVDLNADGATDLMVLGGSFPPTGSNRPQPGFVAFGDGKGGFAEASPALFPGLQSIHAREVAFADFNADGQLDFFIADHGFDAPPFAGAQNRLFLSNGNGSWRDATPSLPAQADFSHSVSVGDLSADGRLDIVVGNSALPSYLYVLLGDGRGNFRADTSMLPTGAGQLLDPTRRNALSSTVADLDGDGYPDLVLGTGNPNPSREPAQVLWSRGGAFDAPAVSSLPWPAYLGDGRTQGGAAPLLHDVQSLDVDFDGDLDLVLAWAREVGREGFELQVLVQDAPRRFIDRTSMLIPDAAARDSRASGDANWIQFLLPADLDGDGRTDFVVDARRGASATMPMALIHRPDGHFDVLRQSDTDWVFNGWTFWSQWPGGSGWLSLTSPAPGQVGADLFELSLAATGPHWVGGTQRPDRLLGTAGADELAGFGGDDRVDGGPGLDVARFQGVRSAHQVQRQADGWTIDSTVDGRDALVNVERVRFDDQHLALDVDGPAGQVARVLQVLFGPDGLRNRAYAGIGLDLIDRGLDLEALVALAVSTPAFAAAAGGRSNAQFVDWVYRNVVGSPPSGSERAFFEGWLETGVHTPASLALLAVQTPQASQQIALAGIPEAGLSYDPPPS